MPDESSKAALSRDVMTSDTPPPSRRDAQAPEPISATPPPVPSDHQGFAPPAPGPDPLIGKVLLDRVRIVRPIARGGMGQVYLAEQTRMKRRCAVKVLDPRFGAAEGIDFGRRFLLEASTASKISHPNVVTIFDYGEAPEGCFIAMEYLEGRSLSEELARGQRLAPERAIHIAQQVARALREAHALGVVHRDVKPGNIFLVKQDDDEDFVKVLDFGLVHEGKSGAPPSARSGREAREPAADIIMGSPRYMAPEQVQGKEIDARADVYSLGAVLYAMLTGHPPFERRTDLATMMAQVSDPPPPMLSAVPELVLPAGLEAIVMRCLEKNPDARWASMEELVASLRDGGPSGAHPQPASLADPTAATARESALPRSEPTNVGSPSERARRTSRRHARKNGWRPLAFAAFVAGVSVLVGIVFLGRPPESGAGIAAANAVTVQPVVPPPPPAPLATATVHIETDPPGAKVNEEGETMCAATPCDVVYTGPAADPSTEHLLAFLLPGYRLERKVARVTGSPVTVTLTKAH
jgi:serine/threonine protein kinase